MSFDFSKVDPNFYAELEGDASVGAGHPRHYKRNGGHIRTFTGRKFYPLDPRPWEVNVSDISQSLALRCRWTGQCNKFYSIATHSVRVAWAAVRFAEQAGIQDPLTLRTISLVALLHDAAEAYLADVASPIKPFLPGWRETEDRVQVAIHRHFGLEDDYPDLNRWVKAADLLVLWVEHNELFATPESLEEFFHGKTDVWPGFPNWPEGSIIPACQLNREDFEHEIEVALSAFQAARS